MRHFALLAVFASFAGTLIAEDGSEVTVEKLRPLQGKWIAQSFESKEGKKEGNGIVLEFIGDTIHNRSPNGTRPSKILAIDTKAVPMQIDLRSDRDTGVIVLQAIFTIEGNLLVCCIYDGPGKRPQRFEATEDRIHIATYKRVGK